MSQRGAPIVVVAGLGLGDEGKGSFVDAWVRRQSRPGWVVRYNGGPQAAHHVVLADGRSHCFAQLGAGMLQPGTKTLLSPYMLVEPLALLREARQLTRLGVVEPLSRTTLSTRSVVVTPFHKLLGRLRELSRGTDRHGSCGLGVGQAFLDSQNPSLPSLRVEDLLDRERLLQRLRFVQLIKVDQAEQLLDQWPTGSLDAEPRALLEELQRRDWIGQLCEGYRELLQSGITVDDGSQLAAALADEEQPLVFEGAQGVLLDAVHGFFPFVTPSRTSFGNAQTLLAGKAATRVGILRAYATRHGPGPLVSEEPVLTTRLDEPHNVANPWQGPMRVGWFDAVAARYALAVVGGVDSLALTCLDRLAGLGRLRLCEMYQFVGPGTPDLEEFFVRNDAGLLTEIRVVVEPSLDRQRRLTALLGQCRPVYRELAPIPQRARRDDTLTVEAEAYVEVLMTALRLAPEQLGCVSIGATAQDKLWR